MLSCSTQQQRTKTRLDALDHFKQVLLPQGTEVHHKVQEIKWSPVAFPRKTPER